MSTGTALASAGPGGKLIVAKTKSARATCAVARADAIIHPQVLGRGLGQLTIIGLGPGAPAWRTPAASAALARASDLVGFRDYLDLVAPLAKDKRRHEFAIGEEEARVRAALDLAAEGREVALVSSGDAGIYGMAALVFELLERVAAPAWRGALRVATADLGEAAACAEVACEDVRAGAPLACTPAKDDDGTAALVPLAIDAYDVAVVRVSCGGTK